MRRKLFLCLILPILLLVNFSPAHAQAAVVHAVLYYSPTCPHCHEVINNVLPPLMDKYGDQLKIIGINITEETGSNLYGAAIEYYKIPSSRQGVPTLIVGDTILVGSGEIPQLFPGIIENGLAAGGIDWPEEPVLRQVLAQEGLLEATSAESSPGASVSEGPPADVKPAEPGIAPTTQVVESTPGLAAPETMQEESIDAAANRIAQDLTGGTVKENLSPMEKYALDPLGNSVSVIVLVAMGCVVFLSGYAFVKKIELAQLPGWLLPVLIGLGLLVSTYLSYVETTQSLAICGPVGDCNAVQQSPYARLFGVLPIGTLGIFGYLALLAAWILKSMQNQRYQDYGAIFLWVAALLGTLFSIYLTFLEPFVIGATCMWCITSAIVITLVTWMATVPAWKAYASIRK